MSNSHVNDVGARRSGNPAKMLAYATGAAAVAALLCAALNRIDVAGYLLIGALASLALRTLLLLYLRLPEDDRRKVLSRRLLRQASLAAVISAVVVSSTYWYAGRWLPLDHLPPAILSYLVDHWRQLDLVPSMFAQVLPISWQSGFHRYFRSGTYCFPGPYWWESMRYLRAAIPGYSLVFFASILFVRLVAVSARRLLR